MLFENTFTPFRSKIMPFKILLLVLDLDLGGHKEKGQTYFAM